MKFAIITHVVHKRQGQNYYGYAPYVREMNLWLANVAEVLVVAPCTNETPNAIDQRYEHENIKFFKIPSVDLNTWKARIHAVVNTPYILGQIFKAMYRADHIHLRCPGNIGLLGCLVQILFPHKPKTAKYAGNWDPKAHQPWSYRLQKWLLSNTFLSRNMQVLVYGEWEGSTKNIRPCFTATYAASEIEPVTHLDFQGTKRFVFVGTLSKGKQPMYAVQLIEALRQKGQDVHLMIYGEGPERAVLQDYITSHQLETCIQLKGNQNKATLKGAYQNSHFVILPSQSEGWPKAIAEGMFWGCVPLATPVSCVPFMLHQGARGELLILDLPKDVAQLEKLLSDSEAWYTKREKATAWSRQYTLDVFEQEIQQCLKGK